MSTTSLVRVFSGSKDSELLQRVMARQFTPVLELLQTNFAGGLGASQITQKGLNTALWKAATQGSAQISNILEEYGGEMQHERNGRLGFAAQLGDCAEIDKLLAAGAEIHSEQDYALRMAVYHNQPEAAGLLCNKGADIRAVLTNSVVMDKIRDGGEAYEGMRGFVATKAKKIAPENPPGAQPA